MFLHVLFLLAPRQQNTFSFSYFYMMGSFIWVCRILWCVSMSEMEIGIGIRLRLGRAPFKGVPDVSGMKFLG